MMPSVTERAERAAGSPMRMLEAFGAYAGPRTGIAQDGTWVFYTLGGD